MYSRTPQQFEQHFSLIEGKLDDYDGPVIFRTVVLTEQVDATLERLNKCVTGTPQLLIESHGFHTLAEVEQLIKHYHSVAVVGTIEPTEQV